MLDIASGACLQELILTVRRWTMEAISHGRKWGREWDRDSWRMKTATKWFEVGSAVSNPTTERQGGGVFVLGRRRAGRVQNVFQKNHPKFQRESRKSNQAIGTEVTVPVGSFPPPEVSYFRQSWRRGVHNLL